jgi:non-ribosomal peptide synthetase component F
VTRSAIAPNQERIWIHSRLQPESWAYNIEKSVDIHGPLDIDRLTDAFDKLIDRHLVLRWVINDDEPAPTWSLDHHAVIDRFIYHDLRCSSDPADDLRRHIVKFAQTPIDLTEGPLCRLLVFATSADHHVATFIVHHIVADAISIGIMWRDLGLFYAAAESELPEIEVDYATYAAQQRQVEGGLSAHEQLSHWLRKLDGVQPDNSYPTTRPRRPIMGTAGGSYETALPPDLIEQIRTMARMHRCTPYMVMLAAFVAMLSHFGRRDEVVIANQLNGRAWEGLESTVGFFVKTLPLRFRLDPDESVSSLLEKSRAEVLDAFGAEEISFESLLHALNMSGDRSMAPFCQVAFQMFVENPTSITFGPSLTVRWLPGISHSAKYDLSFTLIPASGQMMAIVDYSAELYDEWVVERIWDAYVTVLRGMCAGHASVRSLNLVSAAQKPAIAQTSTGAKLATRDDDILAMISKHADTSPTHVAIRSGEREIDRRELFALADQLVSGVAATGVPDGEPVAVAGGGRVEQIAAILGLWRSGHPVCVVDPGETDLPDCVQVGLALDPNVQSLPKIAWVPVSKSDQPTHRVRPPAKVPPETAYIVRTSGTTARSRFVAASYRAYSARVISYTAELADSTGVIQVPSLTHDPGMRDTFTALAAGVPLIVPVTMERDPVTALAHTLITDPADTLFAVLASVLEGSLAVLRARGVQRSMRMVRCCSEPLSRRVAMLTEDVLSCVPHNEYGTSEATMVSVSGWQRPGETASTIMPLGRPTPGSVVLVLGRDLQLVPPGFPGEICISGSHVCDGYLSAPPDDNAFVRTEFTGERNVHRTGDVGYFDDSGILHFLYRSGSVAKLRGRKVSLAEVEQSLACHPSISRCRVTIEGTGYSQQLTARYVGEPIALHDLRSHLRQHLPASLFPDRIVRVETLAVDIRGRYDLSDGTDIALTNVTEELAPHTEFIASAAASAIGIPRLAPFDNFFQMGGHSLSALQLLAAIRRGLGVELELSDVFDKPTATELAQLIAELDRHAD